MDFEELIEVLHGLPGRMVYASIEIPDSDDSTIIISSFSGIVEKIHRGGNINLSEHWYVWWTKDGDPKPDGGTIVLHEDGFEFARVKGTGISFEDVLEQGDSIEDTMGEWTVQIRQFGISIDLLVYVWS